jgi:hypothetical protein
MSVKGLRSESFYGIGAGLLNMYASPRHRPQSAEVDAPASGDGTLHINNLCAIPATMHTPEMIGIADVPSLEALAFRALPPIGPGAVNLYGAVAPAPVPATPAIAACAA